MKKHLVAAGLIIVFASPALAADYYVALKVEMMLENEPNADAIVDAFDQLPANVRALVFRTFATYPHLTG